MSAFPPPSLSFQECMDTPRVIRIAAFVKQPNGKWDLQWDKENLATIFLHDRYAGKKIICFTIVGVGRSGKSTLLNFYLQILTKMENGQPTALVDLQADQGRQYHGFVDGFNWQAGNEPGTDGIWMWSRPFLVKDVDEREVVVVLLDCEGTSRPRLGNKPEEDEILDAQYFSISCLVSSILLYNIKDVVNYTHLNALLSFIEYGTVVNDKEAPFQNLVFLRRDCQEILFGKEANPLAAFRKHEKYADIVKKEHKIRAYNLPLPGKAIREGKKADLIGGRCAIKKVGTNFLYHVHANFIQTLGYNEQNGRISDGVLKSRVDADGKRCYYDGTKFFALLKNVIETYRDADLFQHDHFSSYWASSRAKDAALYHVKSALDNDKNLNGKQRVQLLYLNEFFCHIIPQALNIFKMVHWHSLEVEPGREDGLRGKSEHFLQQCNAFLDEITKIYKDIVAKNEQKPSSWLGYLGGGATGATTMGGAVCFVISSKVVLASMAVNPIVAVVGFAAIGAAMGIGIVKLYRKNLDSSKYAELQKAELTKDGKLEELYKARIHNGSVKKRGAGKMT